MTSSKPPFVPAWDPEQVPAPYLVSAAQVQLVEDYMSDQISADECAARLTDPVQGHDAEGMSDAVFAINTFINHSAASNLPYQAQMLSLVRTIQNLPALEVPEPREDEDGGHISLGDEGKKLWADMPGLGDAWGDDLIAYKATFYDSPETKGAFTKWANAQAWSSRLVSTHDARIAGDFFMHFTSYPIVHVLERDAHPLAALERPAAALAFRVGAAELLRLCRAECRPEPSCALGEGFDDVRGLKGRGGTVLWTGTGGYSLERWAFWKGRWQELNEKHGRDEDIVAVLEAMSHAENLRV
ncbi:hypothetical protein PG984_014728 [Apiospora sp. TS-2023a]